MMPLLISRIARSFGAGVLFFDDAHDVAAFAHDAAQSERVGLLDGQDRQLVAAGRRRPGAAASRAWSAARRRTAPASARLRRAAAAACITAWPVPSCGSCSAVSMSACVPLFCLAPSPAPLRRRVRKSRIICSATSPRAVSITCCNSGLPASGCSTFGSADCMRLPMPAARITTFISSRSERVEKMKKFNTQDTLVPAAFACCA